MHVQYLTTSTQSDGHLKHSHQKLLLLRSKYLYYQLPHAVILDAAYDGGKTSAVGRDLWQWAVDLQQQQQWRMLFMQKAQVAK